MTRLFIFLGYLVFLLLAGLLWCSPWMPIGEKARPVTVRLWHIVILVLACALFFAWVRAVIEEVERTLSQPASWR